MTRSLYGGRHWRTVYELVVALAEHPMHDVDGALALLLDRLIAATGSRDAFVVMATRGGPAANDPMSGLRPRRVINHRTPAKDLELIRSYYSQVSKTSADPHTRAMALGAGTHRAALRCELVDDATWFRSEQVQELFPLLDIQDRLVGACAVSPHAEVFFGCNRGPGDGAYRARERNLMREAMHGLAWFHRRLALSHGLVSSEAVLTPRERTIVAHLMAGGSEKVIASALGLTGRTTHQYVVSIYRRLGVTSRAELTARFGSDGRAPAPSATTLPSFSIVSR